VSAVISTGPPPQKLDMKHQSWSKICTITLGQINTFNYTDMSWWSRGFQYKSITHWKVETWTQLQIFILRAIIQILERNL
jgi:hypothetical protein